MSALPEKLGDTELSREKPCARLAIQCFRVVTLLLVNISDIVERVGNSGFVSQSLSASPDSSESTPIACA